MTPLTVFRHHYTPETEHTDPGFLWARSATPWPGCLTPPVLHKTAVYILDPDESPAKISLPDDGRLIAEPYVHIFAQAYSQRKYWNESRQRFDPHDVLWCPSHKSTERHFEGTRLITVAHVMQAAQACLLTNSNVTRTNKELGRS